MLAEEYREAQPFPHIVLDEFLPQTLALAIRANFPAQQESDRLFQDGYAGLHKRQVSPPDCNGENRDLFAFFNSAAMLQFLEGVVGIAGLIPDPYFNGGGFHEISRGGKLGVHADFGLNDELNLKRRLNVLMYLNDRWDTTWGGQLELWHRAMTYKERAVDPLFNRCVIFSTDEDSLPRPP